MLFLKYSSRKKVTKPDLMRLGFWAWDIRLIPFHETLTQGGSLQSNRTDALWTSQIALELCHALHTPPSKFLFSMSVKTKFFSLISKCHYKFLSSPYSLNPYFKRQGVSIQALLFSHKPEISVWLFKVGKLKVKSQSEISTLVSMYGLCKREARELSFLINLWLLRQHGSKLKWIRHT